MLANPSYGSFESAIFGHDFKTSREEQRKAKNDVLEGCRGRSRFPGRMSMSALPKCLLIVTARSTGRSKRHGVDGTTRRIFLKR